MQYGHPLNLSAAASGMALHAAVERGNPADSSRRSPRIGRHAELYREVPVGSGGGTAPAVA